MAQRKRHDKRTAAAEARAERIRRQFRLSRFLVAVRDAVAKAK